MIRLAFIGSAVLWLAACGKSAPESHPQWVLHSQVKFFNEDLTQPREPLPLSQFRLFFPYIAGDLYGQATTGDFLQPTLRADYTFELDLDHTYGALLRSLQPTEFSLDYLKIDPPEARLARLAPLALEADGIEQVAVADWIDAATREKLLLVYIDRPSRITGTLVREGYTVTYNVRATAPGYVWIARRQTGEGEQMYTEVKKPASVVLALMPVPPRPEPPPRAGSTSSEPTQKSQ